MKTTDNALRPLVIEILPAAAIVLLQALACLFFVADSLADESGSGAATPESILEIAVAFALLAGVVLGAAYLFRLVREIRLRSTAVAIARGALSTIIVDRFSEWRLSAAEADVALFALKGCTASEIAGMRSAAQGTVRAQLSQVYAKAGVSSQAMLMSLFLEDLIDGDTLLSAK